MKTAKATIKHRMIATPKIPLIRLISNLNEVWTDHHTALRFHKPMLTGHVVMWLIASWAGLSYRRKVNVYRSVAQLFPPFRMVQWSLTMGGRDFFPGHVSKASVEYHCCTVRRMVSGERPNCSAVPRRDLDSV